MTHISLTRGVIMPDRKSFGRNRGALPTEIIACIALAVVAGCSPDGELKKSVVRGEVRYNGDLIENGQISFFPLEGTLGQVSGAPIVGGMYLADAKGGVPVGRHRVEIEGYRAAATRDDPDAGEGGTRIQFIPEKYNHKSELTAEVPHESGIVRDFNLSR